MKRIMVTGASGFVGHHFVDYLLQKTDWEVVCPVSCRHKGESLNLKESRKDSRVRLIPHDLNWPFSTRIINDIGSLDFIVNFAAESHVDRSISDPVSFIQNNVNVSLNLLEYARIVRPKAFVQISTDEVYGPAINSSYNHKEWDSIKPSNPYSASKACQEAIAFSYWRTYGVPIIITNTMNNYGSNQQSEKFVPYVVSNIYNERSFGIHGDGVKFSSRYWTYVKNHADAILFILSREVPLYPDVEFHSRFNIVGELELNSLQMVERIASILGKKADWYPIDYHTTRPGHDLRYALDGSKISELGWRPPYDFDCSLQETVLSFIK
jgi:dTDP-glucose 4,6-dehydratase